MIKVGDEFAWRGAKSSFYTPGHTYTVLRKPRGGGFFMDDDHYKRGDMGEHYWGSEEAILSNFDPVLEKAAIDETPKRDIYAEAAAIILPPVRVQILQEGAELTNGNRDAEYGPPAVNLACAGELKAIIRKYLKRDISPGELEAIDQVCTKLGRVATGATPKRDTYVDGATYFAIAGEIALSSVDTL